MVINNNSFLNRINNVPGFNNEPVKQQKQVQNQSDFGNILKEKVEQQQEVKFSKHAELRLQTRNIQLSDQQKEKINQAVKKAEQKGVRDSLVLMDNMAFVVNVRNKTVITAVNSEELKSNVFTNIDGAVIA
jgi:flagellar operon protein